MLQQNPNGGNNTDTVPALLPPTATKALVAGFELAEAAQALLEYLPSSAARDDLGARLVNMLSRRLEEFEKLHDAAFDAHEDAEGAASAVPQ